MGSCRCRRPLPNASIELDTVGHGQRSWPAGVSARVGTMAEVRGEQVGRRLRVDDQLNQYWVPGHLYKSS